MHETNCWIYRVKKPTYCLYSKVISLIIKAYIKSHKKRNYWHVWVTMNLYFIAIIKVFFTFWEQLISSCVGQTAVCGSSRQSFILFSFSPHWIKLKLSKAKIMGVRRCELCSLNVWMRINDPLIFNWARVWFSFEYLVLLSIEKFHLAVVLVSKSCVGGYIYHDADRSFLRLISNISALVLIKHIICTAHYSLF